MINIQLSLRYVHEQFINIVHSLCPCLHHFTEADFEKYQKKYDDKSAQVSPQNFPENSSNDIYKTKPHNTKELNGLTDHNKIAHQMVNEFLKTLEDIDTSDVEKFSKEKDSQKSNNSNIDNDNIPISLNDFKPDSDSESDSSMVILSFQNDKIHMKSGKNEQIVE